MKMLSHLFIKFWKLERFTQVPFANLILSPRDSSSDAVYYTARLAMTSGYVAIRNEQRDVR